MVTFLSTSTTNQVVHHENYSLSYSEKYEQAEWVALDKTDGKIKMLAFLMRNKESKSPLYKFVVSVDEIEALTGIDFFAQLDDTIEEKLESSSSYKSWSF
ncbi:DNA/RNA non-specific endonuclease [Polaribacter atrinae]|uniref:DNA/RNA non-specific endonuclease n=1 Tax=Polaribacter atrinae TaxID=1333662 RepID=UPI0030F7BF72